jgi:hypothetical protein
LRNHNTTPAKHAARTAKSRPNPGSGIWEAPQNAGAVMHKPIITALVKFFIESPFLKIEVQDYVVGVLVPTTIHPSCFFSIPM